MARPESIAVGGYFPTPNEVIPLIAGHLSTSEYISIVDPCAGKGEAVSSLADLLPVRSTLRLCEMEQGRFESLYGVEAKHGDAFNLRLKTGVESVLYLNPPYDFDPVHGRLEEKFLRRFSPILVQGGVLIFIVPLYALKSSAKTLATEYDSLCCMKFPSPEFETFKQVVLFARKVSSFTSPDPKVVAEVLGWTEDTLDVLGDSPRQVYEVPGKVYGGPGHWELRTLDIMGLLSKVRPWYKSTTTGYGLVPHVLPEVPVQDLLFREFPVATPPRPAHIASGMASGLFNGRKVVSDNPELPPLLVKGVFNKEYMTVEEKRNKEGHVTSVVQVQQPRLVITVLDLEAKKYHTLKTSGTTSSLDISEMSVADLLRHYGPSLIQVMGQQCPVLFDPKRDSEELAPVNLQLFKAQAWGAQALVRLLGGTHATKKDRRGKTAVLLGEIGSGKTATVLTVGRTIARRVLVMCPPHLLDSWKEQTLQVLPEAEFRVLRDVQSVDDLRTVPGDKFLVAVLSREAAKLGHGWEGVSKTCPKCGSKVPAGDLAKKRLRCEHREVLLGNDFARRAFELALYMAPYDPSNHRISTLLRGRLLQDRLEAWKTSPKKWEGLDLSWVDTLEPLPHKLLKPSLVADLDYDRLESTVRRLVAEGTWESSGLALDILSLLPPESQKRAELRALDFKCNPWYSNGDKVEWSDGVLTVGGDPPNSLETARNFLEALIAEGSFKLGPKCGEPLYQAVPKPRKVALSKYLKRTRNDFFDLFVIDECHEYASDTSAQGKSAHRINNFGVPTIEMTGSLMNGYASSLFSPTWMLSEDFRKEFGRNDLSKFVSRYGYLKRILTEKDLQTGEVVAFGSRTDRVERSERKVGEAPGVLPLFLFRHLLARAVTLHKADLALDLPPCRQIPCKVSASKPLLDSFQALQRSLVDQIKKDRFDEDLSGKLFGALAELPSYLDRSTEDTGNQPNGLYEIRYPENVGGELVALGKVFPADTLSAKEGWLLEKIGEELDGARNVMVLSWHVNLLPRLARIIGGYINDEVPVLYANKVTTGKRQEWINKNVVKRGRRVLVTNPVAIQTGLNNLVHFSSQIWMENPGCSSTITRQTIGRVDRIGQTKETRIYFPVYEGTLQETLYDLLMRKIAVSTSTDGLDPESALLAAGAAEEGYLSGLSIGKQLWEMLQH